MHDLNARHGAPLTPRPGAARSPFGGHPYLTRKALYLLATNQRTRDADATGPTGRPLRPLRRPPAPPPAPAPGGAGVAGSCARWCGRRRAPAKRVFYRLRGAGLVRTPAHPWCATPSTPPISATISMPEPPPLRRRGRCRRSGGATLRARPTPTSRALLMSTFAYVLDPRQMGKSSLLAHAPNTSRPTACA